MRNPLSAKGKLKWMVLKMARPRRFERPTPAFGGQYSIQLSYRRLATSVLDARATSIYPKQWGVHLHRPQSTAESL